MKLGFLNSAFKSILPGRITAGSLGHNVMRDTKLALHIVRFEIWTSLSG